MSDREREVNGWKMVENKGVGSRIITTGVKAY